MSSNGVHADKAKGSTKAVPGACHLAPTCFIAPHVLGALCVCSPSPVEDRVLVP